MQQPKLIVLSQGPHHIAVFKPHNIAVVGGRGVVRPTLLDLVRKAIGNLDNLHLLLPKLLIPAVANAASNDYLFMRSLALWTSLNFSLFAKVEQRENVNMPKANEIATLWGKINHKYAMSYLESVEHNNDKAKVLRRSALAKETAETAVGWLRDLIGH